MPVEIEIKLKVDDLEAVRTRLRGLGAQRVGEALETNCFFDTADRALLASDCGLRLRRSRDVNGGKEKLILTYKGPRGEGAVKQREEVEVVVDRVDNVTALLERLGYTQHLSFEKRRETWRLERCTIELDSLPQLGSFVEIECATEADVLRVQEKLGLTSMPTMSKTYADMVAHHLSDRGVREHNLTFAS